MARSRNIKPGFFLNDELASLDMAARLLFAGLWCVADREGRLEDKIKKIKIQIFPYDDIDIDKLLNDLHQSNFITRYSVDDNQYIQINNFLKHQNPHHRESNSVIPPFTDTARNKPRACPVQAQDKPSTGRADSLNLIPDSLNLIPSSASDGLFDTPVEISPELDEGEGAQVEANAEPGKGIEYTPEFEEFWAVYPRAKEKRGAYRCWLTRLKEGTKPRELIRAAQLYADECIRLGTQEKFIKWPKSFLGPNKPFLDYISDEEVNISGSRYKREEYTG